MVKTPRYGERMDDRTTFRLRPEDKANLILWRDRRGYGDLTAALRDLVEVSADLQAVPHETLRAAADQLERDARKTRDGYGVGLAPSPTHARASQLEAGAAALRRIAERLEQDLAPAPARETRRRRAARAGGSR
jgi:hypothetical protein